MEREWHMCMGGWLHVQGCSHVCVCDMVVTAKNIIDRPCVHQHKFGSCCDC